MNWDNIKVFVAVNRFGSIGKAAKELGINHSTILRRLASLEKELSLKLFNRLSSGYEITRAGEGILEQALKMEDEANSLLREASSSEYNSSDKLIVALPPAGSLQVMPLIAAFRKQYPYIETQLNFDVALSNLNTLEAEVAIRYTNEPPENYVGLQVLNFKTRMYASKDYLNSTPIASLKDINDWLLVDIPGLTDMVEAWIKTASPNASIAIRTNSTLMAAEAASHNMGVTFITENIAEQYTNLLPVDIDGYENDMGIWILTHQDLRYQKRIRLFFDFMKEGLKNVYSQNAI